MGIPLKNIVEIKCGCGKTVLIYDALTNECGGCGQLFNGFGQELSPRDEWQENDC
jgi:hypothetical protein